MFRASISSAKYIKFKMYSIRKIFFAISVVLCFLNMKWAEDDANDFVETCDEITIVDKDLYADLDSANFTFVNAEITNDCLNIEIGASGCDGNTWRFSLVDSGDIAESSPEQRFLKFQLINEELCLAFFKRIVSFDLKPLRINGSNEVIFNI